MFRESEDYEHFADFIRTKSRYVLDGRQQDFVNTIVESSKTRTNEQLADFRNMRKLAFAKSSRRVA